MSSVSQFWNRSHDILRRNGRPTATDSRAIVRTALEYVWMGATFLLFICLGPFAVIAVVPAVFSLALNNAGEEPGKAVPSREGR